MDEAVVIQLDDLDRAAIVFPGDDRGCPSVKLCVDDASVASAGERETLTAIAEDSGFDVLQQEADALLPFDAGFILCYICNVDNSYKRSRYSGQSYPIGITQTGMTRCCCKTVVYGSAEAPSDHLPDPISQSH